MAQIDDNKALDNTRDLLESDTLLGQEIMRQWRDAMTARTTQKIGDYSLAELLSECHAARDDRTLCAEQEFHDKYPQWAAMPVSIVAFKVGILVALIRESLADVAQAPFIVDPTPKPDIPEESREEALDGIMARVEEMAAQVNLAQQDFVAVAAQQGIPPEIASQHPSFPRLPESVVSELVAQEKLRARQKVEDHARDQARLLQQDLYDKTIEGGYRRAILEVADDFATYPFACMHGPFPVMRKKTVWKKDADDRKSRFVEENRISWAFERVSPFDFLWTPDSTTTQDGTAVFIRSRVGVDYLYDARRQAARDPNSGYREYAIDELLERVEEGHIPRMWIDYFSPNPEGLMSASRWLRGEVIEILVRYGRFTGFELGEMGFTGLEDDVIYETKTIMCGGQVIQCQLNRNPGDNPRPVFTASFEARNGQIPGVGLGQRLLSVHKAYRAVIHLMMYNLGLSSEPITEVDIARISEYLPEDWVDNPVVSPGMIIPSNDDRYGNGSRAIKFTQIPATTAEALRLASFIFELSHVVSNIPAALHGQPVGSGANRTVRGLLTLQGNTLKPIQSALMNLDMGIVEPMITLLYMLLVMHDDDFEYSGDCTIVAKGAASMVQREMEKQTAMENLQIVSQFGDHINPDVLNRTFEKLLSIAGIIEPGEKALAGTPPPAQTPAAPPGIPGQPPSEPVEAGSAPPAQ